MTEHTPTPWEISELRTVDDTAMIVGGEEFKFGLIADVTEDADAAFIVKACNSHEALVEACEAAIDFIYEVADKDELPEHWDVTVKLRDALSLTSAERE